MTHDDPRVERVAEALANADADNGGNWYSDEDGNAVFPHWDDLPDGLEADVGGEYQEWLIRGKKHYRSQAAAAIAALDIDPPLEDLLAGAGIYDVYVLAVTLEDGSDAWECIVKEPVRERRSGTGATIDAAIRAAIANAKEVER